LGFPSAFFKHESAPEEGMTKEKVGGKNQDKRFAVKIVLKPEGSSEKVKEGAKDWSEDWVYP